MVDSLGCAKTQYRYAAPGRYTGQPSLIHQPQLCDKCSKNQATKIQELNSFEPSRESYFQSELDAHKHQLDERYKLCRSCHDIVKYHLNVQAMDLKTFLLGSHLQQSKSTPTKLLIKRSSSPESISVMLAQLVCVFLASLLVCSDSLSSSHNTCDDVFNLWNSSCMVGHVFWSNFTSANFTTAAKHLVFHLTRSLTMSSSWERSLELMLCLCSLAKRRYLHILLFCLLINILIFLKRKNRFGILILLSWTSLSALKSWEVFWLTADCGWRTTAAAFCLVLGTCSFIFSLLSYSRIHLLGTRKTKRYKLLTPCQSTTEKHHNTDSEIMDTTNESEPSHEKTATELDHNLNGLSLGLPAERRNGYNIQLSPGNTATTGSFWSQNMSSDSKETPLVSMRQRPLIVPATLHFSGLRERFPASHARGETSGKNNTKRTSLQRPPWSRINWPLLGGFNKSKVYESAPGQDEKSCPL